MISGRFSFRSGAVGAVLALFVACLFSPCHAAPAANQTLEVDTTSGAHRFRISVMRTDAEREKGLMFVKSMPRDEGMLFDFKRTQQILMWMKNTLLPLDMVFIGADGHVVNIARDAKPEDETIIPSKEPALGVLEINGGGADAIGLKIGDVVRHPMFHDTPAP